MNRLAVFFLALCVASVSCNNLKVSNPVFEAGLSVRDGRIVQSSFSAGGKEIIPFGNVPVFELCLDGKVWTSDDPVWKYAGTQTKTLANGGIVKTYRFGGLDSLSGLVLEWDREYFKDAPVIRERMRLRSSEKGKFHLTDNGGKQHLVFPRYTFASDAAQAEVTELSMARFTTYKDEALTRQVNHPDTVSFPLKKGDAPIPLKGPLMIVRTPQFQVITSYEHASQDRSFMGPGRKVAPAAGNDAFQDIQGNLDFLTDDDFWFIATEASLRDGGLIVDNHVRRGAYLDGEEIPSDGWYETMWSSLTLLEPDADPYDAIHDYIYRRISDHLPSRKAHFYYNTWGMQRAMPEDSLLLCMDEKRLLREIDHAAEMGLDCFVIDYGWSRLGDWTPDKDRLPNGLAPLVERINSHGMTTGVWISLAGTNYDMPAAKEHPEWLVKDMDGNPVRGQFEYPVMDLVGPYYNVLLSTLKSLVDQGVRYFKWDSFDTALSDCPGLWHGDESNTRKERIDRYNYLAPVYAVRLMRELREYCPDLVIENDLTEWERCMIGLMPLQEGKLYFINNGASWYGDYTSLRTRSLRGVINEYSFFMPQEVFTYAMFPQDNDGCSIYNTVSALTCGHGFWGNLDLTTAEQRAAIRDLVMKAKRVLPHVAGCPVRKTGMVDDAPEVYVQANSENGYGLVTAFSQEDVDQDLVIPFKDGSVLGVIGHPFSSGESGIVLPLDLKGRDACAAAFIIGAEGKGPRVLSSTGILSELRKEKGGLYVKAGEAVAMKIVMPGGRIREERLSAGEDMLIE